MYVRSNKDKKFISAKTPLPPPDLLKVLEDRALNDGIISSTELSYNTHNFYTEKLHVIPFNNEYHIILITRMQVIDSDLSTPMPIDTAIVIQDDFVEAKKCEVLVSQDKDTQKTQIELPTNAGTLVIKCRPEERLLYGDHFCQLSRIYAINVSIILDMFSCKPSKESFVNSIKEMFIRLDYDAFAVFVSNQNQTFDEIAFFSKSDDARSKCKRLVEDMIKSPERQTSKISNFEGYRGFGYKYELGGIYYILQGVINHSFFIVRSPERMISSWAILIASYYHTYFSIQDDSHALERLKKLLGNNPLLSIIEMNNNCLTQIGSIFSNEKTFSSVDQFNDLFIKATEKGRSIIQYRDKLIGITGKKFFDVVTNSDVSTLLIEDLTYFKKKESQIRSDNSDIETASMLLNFHKLSNESTVADDSLSHELGYHIPIYSLLELIYPDDVHILREIKPDRISIFRLKEATGNPAWYAAICAESTNNSFVGFTFSISEFTSDKSFTDENFDDSILAAVSDLFALWSLDLETGEVVSSIVHTPFISAHIEDIYKLVHPNDVGQFKDCVTKPGNNQSLLSRCQLRMSLSNTNEYVWHEVLVSQIRSNKVIVLVLNVSEQKSTLDALVEARQLVDLALYHSSVVQWIFEDADTPERIFTSGPITYEPLLINWTSIYHNILPEFQEVTRNTFLKALNSDEPFEVKAPIFFDSIRWILLRGRRGVKKGQLIGVYFDLTELKEASNALEKQRKAAEEAASAKSVFLANMSHEIRTPLNGMCGLLEFLQASDVTEEEQVMLNYIQSSFTRLLELLNDTLDLAKIDQNKMQVSYTNFAPLEIIEPLFVQTYNQLKNNPSVYVRMELEPTFPLLFYGDPHFTNRILINLVSNALKFTEKGYICLCFKIGEDGSLVAAVKDTGIGISQEKQQMIFESFTQLDSSITRPYGGSGIGLSLVSKMVKLLNGTITIVSDLGKGSTFTVSFPFQPVYVPFLTRKVKETKLQFLVLFDFKAEAIVRNFSNFYGIDLIRNVGDVINNNLVIIMIQNEPDQTEAALKITDGRNEIQKFVILASEKMEHDPRFEGISWPLTPSFLRKRFLEIKFHRKKSRQRDPKDLRLNVLIAEDNQTNQLVVSRILQKLQCQWKIVDNGQEVIDALESQQQFDLILMDHHMPEVDGPEATRRIRSSQKEYARIPIIAMTASTAKEDKDECINSGMNTFVSKPVKVAELAQIMMRVVDQTPEQY